MNGYSKILQMYTTTHCEEYCVYPLYHYGMGQKALQILRVIRRANM